MSELIRRLGAYVDYIDLNGPATTKELSVWTTSNEVVTEGYLKQLKRYLKLTKGKWDIINYQEVMEMLAVINLNSVTKL